MSNHDLIRSSIILLDGASATLPQTLALLSADKVEGFEGLQAHQRQSWFLFLVQVAALALAPDDTEPLPDDPGRWRDLLLALTPGDEETAWSLLVADPARPALLQPPVRDPAAWARMQPLAITPDAIDVLITAKNHDVKQARIGVAEPHHWLYALVSLQTSQGFLGRGNFGIARMNGGFGSRPLVELVPSMRWGQRFRRAVAVARRQRIALRERGVDFRYGPDALRLLWLLPWDREESLAVPDLDPFAIEICRRVRLCADADGRWQALARPSEVARIDAKDRKGLMDDPWTPVNLGTGGAYTVSGEGFRYDRVADLLLDKDKFRLCPALRPLAGDGEEMLVHLSALVRGQGKTEGLHERVVPVNPARMRKLFDEGERASAHALAQQLVGDAKAAIRAVKMGLLCLMQGVPEKIKLDDPRARPELLALDAGIDAAFFTHLWRRLDGATDAERDAAQLDWRLFLHKAATAAFRRGCDRLPVPAARRERNRVLAENLYRAVLRKHVPLPDSTPDDKTQEDAA